MLTGMKCYVQDHANSPGPVLFAHQRKNYTIFVEFIITRDLSIYQCLFDKTLYAPNALKFVQLPKFKFLVAFV